MQHGSQQANQYKTRQGPGIVFYVQAKNLHASL